MAQGNMLKFIKIKTKKIIMRLCYLTRNRKEQIAFFSSFGGTQYSDSPRAVSELLHKMKPSIKIVWLGEASIQKDLPHYVVFVKCNSLRALVYQARSSVWVLNVAYARFSYYYKGPRILYIQTWHGDRAFKKIGWSAFKTMGDKYSHKSYLPYLDDCDYVTVGSMYGEIQAREGLNYKGELLKSGLPRNDKLFFPNKYQDYIDTVKAKLNIPKEVKILLYAPTFRDYNKSNFDSLIDIRSCIDRLSEDGSQWMAIVRAHFGSTIIFEEKSNIIDVSSYSDMADLLLIADCLISDYSSCAGDYILTKRPCVLAIFDQVEYEKYSRALWITPKEAGFVVANNQEELNHILSNLNTYDFESISDRIIKKYGSYDRSDSTMQVCNKIIEWCIEQQIDKL